MVDVNRNWEKIYENKATPWDVGKPEDTLVRLVSYETIKPCRVLELGCGHGNDSIFLASFGFDVTAVDVSAKAIETAKRRATKEGVKINFLVGDVTQLKLAKGSFQMVYDRACFHFIPEEKREGYLNTLRKFLRKGGYFVLIASSDRDTVTGPYSFSKKDIKNIFGKDFEILNIKLINLKQHALKPRPYLCFMRKR